MYTKGFTLIELMVSVTIFIVVMTVSLGALLAMSASDRKAEAVKTIMNNLSFALESMSRTIRTGYNYTCTGGTPDCNTTPSYRFTFTAANGSTVSYCLGSGTSCGTGTTCTDTNGCRIMRRIGTSGNFEPLTAPEVKVSDLKFYLVGSNPSDFVQSRVIVTLSGSIATSGTVPTKFELQTSVTQRLYDQ